MRVVGSGTGGLIGAPLFEKLSRSHDVIRLKRPPSAEWDAAVEGASAVVNLAGENIASGRWTPSRKKELIQSRLMTTRALVDAMGRAAVKPGVFLSASATGFYGPRGDEPLGENAPKGEGFLADLCAEWERQARRAESFGIRVVLLRTGVVLAKKGGALSKMLPPFRAGLGGPIGSGHQYFSWIHLEDEIAAIEFALTQPLLSGPINLTAPESVTMEQFSSRLAQTLGRPAFLRVPALPLRILLGEMSEMLLTGQNVRPDALLKAGFRFRFDSLTSALIDLISK